MSRLGVYIIKEGNIVRYVGSGILEARKYRHSRGDTEIGRYILEKGLSMDDCFSVVYESDDREELYRIEEEIARKHGLITEGGTLIGCQYGKTAGIRKRIKISENHADVSGASNPNYGGKFHGIRYVKEPGVPMRKWYHNERFKILCTKLDKPEGWKMIQPRDKRREYLMSLPEVKIEDIK